MLKFESDDAQIKLTSGLPSNAPVSFSIRMRLDADQGANRVIIGLGVAFECRWMLYINVTGDNLRFFNGAAEIQDVDSVGLNSVILGVPVVIGVKWDGATARIYLNGAVIHSAALAEFTNTPTTFFLGTDNVNAAARMTVMNLKVWNEALSDAEMLEEACSDPPVRVANLYGSYQSLGTGDGLQDDSGGGHTFTATAGTLTDVADWPDVNASTGGVEGRGITVIS